MAPKRSKKRETNEENKDKYKNLVISDALCPICRSILIEPVTLPCNHGFCLTCFNTLMENTALTCPLCRIRIGSWLRSVRKSNNIVNTSLWTVIQRKFSKEVNQKLQGNDLIEQDKTPIKLAVPGEIRKEYEIELEKEALEIQKQRESEAKASEIVIKQILEEENNAAQLEAEKLRMDEEVARRLANELSSSNLNTTVPATPKSKKSSIDKYLIALNKKKQEINANKSINNSSSSKSVVNTPNKNKSTINTRLSKSVFNTSSKNKSNINNSTLTTVFNTPNKNKLNNSSSSSNSTFNTPTKNTIKNYTTTVMCQSRGKGHCSKAYQHLLFSKSIRDDINKRAESNDRDSVDSIKQETIYFKPIRVAPLDKNYSDKYFRTQLLKIPTIHPIVNPSATIRSPQYNLIRLKAHSGSAFVSFAPEPQVICTAPVKQPSIISESGKVVKQYYNRKRNIYPIQISTVTSPQCSPCLGFDPETNKDVTKRNNIIKTISEYINKISNRCKQTEITLKAESENNSIINKVELKKSIKSPQKINGINTAITLKSADAKLQEQLDLEFAKKLHEEINNLRIRQTRASINLNNSVVKNSRRSNTKKRQSTLDEMITPKKLKI